MARIAVGRGGVGGVGRGGVGRGGGGGGHCGSGWEWSSQASCGLFDLLASPADRPLTSFGRVGVRNLQREDTVADGFKGHGRCALGVNCRSVVGGLGKYIWVERGG